MTKRAEPAVAVATQESTMLTTASLLSILFITFHLTADILFKIAPAVS